MKAGELLKLLNNLPASTLHKYVQDYQEYLSPSTASRHREYTETDARVLKLIIEMKTERMKPQDIEVTLSSLRDGGWSQLPALDQAMQSIIPTQGNQIAAQLEISAMKREIEIWRELAEKSSADRDELLRRLHEAEMMVRLYESKRLPPPT